MIKQNNKCAICQKTFKNEKDKKVKYGISIDKYLFEKMHLNQLNQTYLNEQKNLVALDKSRSLEH